MLGRQHDAWAGAVEPVAIHRKHRYLQLRRPEGFHAGDFLLVTGNDDGLRLAGQYLLAADLRPRHAAVGKDVLCAAQRQHLTLQRRARAGEQRLGAELQQHPSRLTVRIFCFQRGNLLTDRVRGLIRLFWVWAVLGQVIQPLGDVIDGGGIGIKDRDAKRGDLIQHPLWIAAAPGQDQIRL
ncbi:hypothetical protein D3C80_1499770 [compost metagenome]